MGHGLTTPIVQKDIDRFQFRQIVFASLPPLDKFVVTLPLEVSDVMNNCPGACLGPGHATDLRGPVATHGSGYRRPVDADTTYHGRKCDERSPFSARQ